MDVRCKVCNWMNLEVQNEFICKNCKKENIIEKTKEIVKEIVKEDVQYNSKGRNK